MLNISKVSKLDGIRSWSLQAGDTCPGAFNADGSFVDACSGCYARGGNYRFSNVKKPRQENRQDWKRDEWVSDMVQALKKETHFRWFDSGDMYSLSLAKKMYQVMAQATWVKFWLPTRMYKFVKFQSIIDAMDALPNVKVRFSSDSITGEFTKGLHGSTIVPDYDSVPASVKVCEAYKHEGKCNGCRSCWDKTVDVIAYPAHGATAKKNVRIKLALVA